MKRNKLIQTIKLIKEFIRLKKRGYDKDQRYYEYALKGIINFEQYVKHYDNKIRKEEKQNAKR